MSGNTRIAVAIHIMTALAFEKKSMTSAELAESIGTNAVVVRRLLSLLARAGLVQCTTGKLGGSHLAKDAGQISLADIYAAVSDQESLFGIPEKRPNRQCPVSCQMRRLLENVFQEAEYAVRGQFKSVMLSDFTKGVQ